MKYLLFLFKITVSVLFLGLFHFAAYAHADQLPGAENVCPAVFPCDLETGELLAEYSNPENECYDTFRSQCDFEQTIRSMSDRLSACEVTQIETNLELTKFRKRVRRLKRKIRSLRQ